MSHLYQNISNIAIVLGVILSAIGSYGSYYFGKQIERQNDIQSQASEAKLASQISQLSFEKDAALKTLNEKNNQLTNLSLLNGELDSQVMMGLFRVHLKEDFLPDQLSDFKIIVELDAMAYRFMLEPSPCRVSVDGVLVPALAFNHCSESYSGNYDFTFMHGDFLSPSPNPVKYFSCNLAFGLSRGKSPLKLRDFHQTHFKVYLKKAYVGRLDRFDIVLNSWAVSEICAENIIWQKINPGQLPDKYKPEEWVSMNVSMNSGFPFQGAIIDLFNGKPSKLFNLRN